MSIKWNSFSTDTQLCTKAEDCDEDITQDNPPPKVRIVQKKCIEITKGSSKCL